jgi:glutaconate CoA-transferase subunit A
MRDKLTTLDKAASLVKTGAQVVMTANLQRAPMALLRQVVKQGTRDLRVVGVVGGDLNIDFLVGAGAVRIVDTCSVTLGEFARTGPNFARYVQEGRVRSLDNT